MDAQRRELGRAVKRLRTALDIGGGEGFAAELERAASREILAALREQKVFPKASPEARRPMACALRAAAMRVLDDVEATQYAAYLEFIEVWHVAHRDAGDRLSVVLRLLPSVGVRQLLESFDEALGKFLDALPWSPVVEGQTVADYERGVHEFNGRANDTLYAGLRALNEAARRALHPQDLRLSRTERDLLVRRLEKATQIAAELNGLETVLDWVTYGDMVVTHVVTGPAPRVIFDYADARLNLLRILAMRRDLITNLNRARGPRRIRDMLKASENALLRKAVTYYSTLVGIDAGDVDMDGLLDDSAVALVSVQAEDDFAALAGAKVGDDRASVYYLVAMGLRWFELAASAVRKQLPRGRRRLLAAPEVPVWEIEAGVARGGGGGCAATLVDLTNQLPVRNHHDLARRPFVRESGGATRCLSHANGAFWTAPVREALITGGAHGDAYGRLWEMYYAHTFEESDWVVIGRNIKLRRVGQTATDVDLLLKHDDLLLVVQVKALLGSLITIYDHWRNRQTIEWGCRQARTAADFLRKDPAWLSSVAGAAVAAEVRHIQPLVLTTVNAFDGWRFEGVPVLGEVGRKSITRGAKVQYTDPRSGAVISTRQFTDWENITTQQILWSLDNPVEMLIAPEGLEVGHREVSVPGFTAVLPEFQLRDGIESFPAIVAVP